MKLLSVNQIREADTYTIGHEPIASIDLMERAALACVNWITVHYNNAFRVKIVCGTGNNGGDGLAIARLLNKRSYKVQVYIINHTQNRAADFTINYERLKTSSNPDLYICEINTLETFPVFDPSEHCILIDALFGSGLNKPLSGFVAHLVDRINKTHCKKIAIDVPSGLYSDQLNDAEDKIIMADHTLTFHCPKLAFMFPETANYVGDFCVLDIGLHKEHLNTVNTSTYFITADLAQKLLKKRSKVAHKGNFGHSLLVAGSYGKLGAAVLAAKACARSGTGLLTVHLPKCGYEILQSTVPEAMVEADKEFDRITDTISVERYNAIGIGPGMGTDQKTQAVIKFLIQNSSIPLVFDADAINIIAENKTWLSFIPGNSIFTPHVKEFERLTGKAASSAERLKLQAEFSIKYSAYIILKGAHTAITSPDGLVFFNSTGNPGMAKGGSGDVLTGIITALLAQHYTSKEACILGVYIHGLAADIAVGNKSTESLIASDIIAHLPEAFTRLRNREQ